VLRWELESTKKAGCVFGKATSNKACHMSVLCQTRNTLYLVDSFNNSRGCRTFNNSHFKHSYVQQLQSQTLVRWLPIVRSTTLPISNTRTVVAPSYVQQLPSQTLIRWLPIIRSTTLPISNTRTVVAPSYVQQLPSQTLVRWLPHHTFFNQILTVITYCGCPSYVVNEILQILQVSYLRS